MYLSVGSFANCYYLSKRKNESLKIALNQDKELYRMHLVVQKVARSFKVSQPWIILDVVRSKPLLKAVSRGPRTAQILLLCRGDRRRRCCCPAAATVLRWVGRQRSSAATTACVMRVWWTHLFFTIPFSENLVQSILVNTFECIHMRRSVKNGKAMSAIIIITSDRGGKFPSNLLTPHLNFLSAIP